MPTDEFGNPDRSKIDFYIIFRLDATESFSINYEDEINMAMLLNKLIILIIVTAGFSLVLFLIILMTMKTSRRITGTIKAIELFTTELKTKTDLDSKRKLINEFSGKEMFRKISKQYDKMESAKRILAEKR